VVGDIPDGISFPGGTAVRLVRTLPASPDRVWTAFTQPDVMVRWMWADYATNAVAEVDLRVGGQYSVATDAPEGDFDWPSTRWAFRGLYVEVAPPVRLVYTLRWDAPVSYNQSSDAVLDEAVAIDLEPVGEDQTRLTMLHMGIPDETAARAHGEGVTAMVDGLEAVLVKR
jgi:uncharacterized protein YndB with AHSA1/START domain